MAARRRHSTALDRRYDLQLAMAHPVGIGTRAKPARGNGRASAEPLQQKVERARHLADRADGDAGVKRRRVELLVSEQDPGLRRGRLWMTRISVFCSRR